MGERKETELSKADIEAANQMILGKKRMRETAPLLGGTLRIVNESLFTLGNESEPYSEAIIDTMIRQEWETPQRRRKTFSKKISS